VERYVLEQPETVKTKDPFTWLTPLQVAVMNKQKDVVRVLVAHGADVNGGRFDFERTPLVLAVTTGDLALCEFLLLHGADPNKDMGSYSGKTMCRMTPLEWALEKGNQDMIELIRRHGGKRYDRSGKER